MLTAVTSVAWLALAGAAPSNHVLPVQETATVKIQPVKREALAPAKKDCADRFVKAKSDAKFYGDLTLSVRYRNQTVVKLFNVAPDDVIAFMAPASWTTALGLSARGYLGCSYNIRNGQLVFRGMEFKPGIRPRAPGEK